MTKHRPADHEAGYNQLQSPQLADRDLATQLVAVDEALLQLQLYRKKPAVNPTQLELRKQQLEEQRARIVPIWRADLVKQAFSASRLAELENEAELRRGAELARNEKGTLFNSWGDFLSKAARWHWFVSLAYAKPTVDMRKVKRDLRRWISWLHHEVHHPRLPHHVFVPELQKRGSIHLHGLVYLGEKYPVDRQAAAQKWYDITMGDGVVDSYNSGCGGAWYTVKALDEVLFMNLPACGRR